MYTVILSNGHKIENLTLNGNNYIAQTVVPDDVFRDNMSKVIISDGETEVSYHDVQLLSNIVRDGQSWIVLGEKTEQQKKEEMLQAEIADLKDQLAAAKIILGVE